MKPEVLWVAEAVGFLRSDLALHASYFRRVALAANLPLLIIFLVSPAAVPLVRAQEPSFRSSSSELVVVPVIVTDRPDHYVPDLTRDQFAVYDNGRPVDVQFFSSEDTPVTAGLVVDSSSSMRRKLGEVIAAASAFAQASNPEDELFALYFNDDVYDTLPDQKFLPASDLVGFRRALSLLVPQGRTALYDALLVGLERLASGTRARKVLVLISDGGDNASRSSLERVLERAKASNAAIYTIGLFDETDLDRNPRVLKRIATATGGERYLPHSAAPLLEACRHIAREIRSGYTIGYVPPDRDGAYHRIRVEVTSRDRRKLIVRTRPGYFASRDTTQ
jgi:Ca-activated chloride channel family protein